MRPRQGAAAAILDEHGRLLLVKENYDRRRRSLPGGAVEPAETPLEAVIREAHERRGSRFEWSTSSGCTASRTASPRRCSAARSRAASRSIAEVGWFPPAAIPEPTSNVVHHALPDIVAGRRGVVPDDPRIN